MPEEEELEYESDVELTPAQERELYERVRRGQFEPEYELCTY